MAPSGREHGGHLVLARDLGQPVMRLRRAQQDPGIMAEPAACAAERGESSRRCRTAGQRGPRLAGGVLAGQPRSERADIKLAWAGDAGPGGVPQQGPDIA
jgi:hypothetical protein